MVKFEYKKLDYGPFFEWNAHWDGLHDNDPIDIDLGVKHDDITPFDKHTIDEDYKKVGGIVFINTLTTLICEMLSNPVELIGNTKNKHAYYYRRELIGTLQRLWD